MKFIENYKLETDNKLYAPNGELAEKAGMTDAYVVIRINAVEKKEYKDFEAASAAQEILDAVLNQNLTAEVTDLITENIKASKQLDSVKKVMDLNKKYGKASTTDEKAKIKTAIENEFKKLSEDQVDSLKEALGLG
jgi:hypothetical protein